MSGKIGSPVNDRDRVGHFSAATWMAQIATNIACVISVFADYK